MRSLTIILVSLLAVAGYGQGSGSASTGTGGNHLIQGHIFFPSGHKAETSIQVKLESYISGEISVMTDASGSFAFGSLAPGNYTVVVNAGSDYEIARENVTIDSDVSLSRTSVSSPSIPSRYTVMITLQPKSDVRPKASLIDAALAEVPENARTLYEKGLELGRAGDALKAIDNLKAAVSLYPKFMLALNEIGVQYLKLGQASKALEPLKRASMLAPDAFSPQLNLGIALLETRQFAAAETQLREALNQKGSAPTAHMYLGLTLVRLSRYREAQKELELAISQGGEHLALAHRYLGGLYISAGKNKEAADELEKYLKLDPGARDAERIRDTIKELRGKS